MDGLQLGNQRLERRQRLPIQQRQQPGLQSPVSSQTVPGEAVLAPLQDAQDKGMAALVTVPMQDYVAADESGPVPQANGPLRRA